ncbi:decapping and exoribonuclease protein-like [Palaemon carinicauda]|uniref:decapping and exoribonuclease protein-like n=1 Tax=Palaemon carinicauda TaxID=392227 RepID=UPI0035B61262
MDRGRGRGRGSTFRGRGRGYGARNPTVRVGKTADGMEIDPKDVFQIKRPQTYSGDADFLHRPNIQGCYSVDSEREFGHDNSLLHFVDTQYLQEEGKLQVQLDLNRGRDKHNMYTGIHIINFQGFLNWILNNQECARESSERLTTDFISLRGNFINIMRTPYDILSWTMYATEFKGSIYILNWPTEEFIEQQKKPEMDDPSKWGHAFKHYMRGGDPEDGVDANEEYYVVFKNQIGQISLFYPAKVDCVDPELFEEDFKNMESFVSIKCCKELTDDRKRRNFKRFKLNQIWCENKLADIPRTIVGFRTDDGVVHSLELLKTDKLPEICEDEWDPNVCLNFLVVFLNFVKERVHREPGTTFKFHREAWGHSIYCSKLTGTDHINMLPTWYTDGLFAEDFKDESKEQSYSLKVNN